jgi:hypothetical protein
MTNTHTSILEFNDSNLLVDARYALARAILEEHECTINFNKINGENRSIRCTLREDILPISSAVLKDDIAGDISTAETLTVWSTDSNAWRSIKTMNIINISPVRKSWTVTIEEDPSTRDLILPLPQELLNMQGWAEGDTLEWIDNKDGSWSIQKAKND